MRRRNDRQPFQLCCRDLNEHFHSANPVLCTCYYLESDMQVLKRKQVPSGR